MPKRWGWGRLIIGCNVLFTGRRAYNWGKRWWGLSVGRGISGGLRYGKQLMGEVFVISRIMKVEVRTRLITRTKTLIIPDITKNKSNHYFIIHCFEIHSVKYTDLTWLLELMHYSRNLQISQLSASR